MVVVIREGYQRCFCVMSREFRDFPFLEVQLSRTGVEKFNPVIGITSIVTNLVDDNCVCSRSCGRFRDVPRNAVAPGEPNWFIAYVSLRVDSPNHLLHYHPE